MNRTGNEYSPAFRRAEALCVCADVSRRQQAIGADEVGTMNRRQRDNQRAA
jgi:hypothetical protein